MADLPCCIKAFTDPSPLVWSCNYRRSTCAALLILGSRLFIVPEAAASVLAAYGIKTSCVRDVFDNMLINPVKNVCPPLAVLLDSSFTIKVEAKTAINISLQIRRPSPSNASSHSTCLLQRERADGL